MTGTRMPRQGIAWIVLCGIVCGPAVADAQSPVAPVSLREGTEVDVALTKSLKSGSERDGDPIVFAVSADVFSTSDPHTLFISKGALAMGRIIVSKPHGMIGESGSLQFSCDYALAVDNRRVYLRGGKCIGGKGSANVAASVVTTVLIGAAGLFIQGGNISAAKGTTYRMYVDQDANLRSGVTTPPPAPAAAAPR